MPESIATRARTSALVPAATIAVSSQATAPSLAATGVTVHQVNQPGEAAETVAAAARLAFSTGRAVAVLISQRVIGYKTFGR